MSLTPKNVRNYGKLRDARALIEWAVQEIRDMDELCRSQVPGYDPLHSDDMANLHALKELAAQQ